jgi:cysteine synthase
MCNIVTSIKLARHAGLGPDDAIVTVATDGAPLYLTERDRVLERDFPAGFDAAAAAATFGETLLGAAPDHVLELTELDRRRIFNLGYYTWVEQQGVPIGEFTERREQGFWMSLHELLARWDAMIEEFNGRVGVARPNG